MKILTTKPYYIGFALLTAIAFGRLEADVQQVEDNQLTMNADLREDINRTLRHLNYDHYLPSKLNDELSARIFDAYLNILDPNKLYFSAADIKQLSPLRSRLDDLLLRRDAEAAFDIFKLFRQRLQQRTNHALELIASDFDFSREESILIDSDQVDWAHSKEELEDRWRKRIKNDVLVQVMAETPEEEIQNNLRRRYSRQQDVTFQLKRDEVFEWFMNAYVKEIGPHTQYMSHATSENFQISMSLQLEGIGAALQTDQDYTVINRIITGGPADKSGELKADDKIVGVGQEEGDFVNVIGWRLMDVVRLIRGEKGSIVRLQVLKNESVPGSPPDEIELIRDVIHLEDQAAKLSQVEIGDGDDSRSYAVIRIPSFYFNEGSAGTKDDVSTSRDVRKLLDEVKQSNAEGVIIDLRGNGGGYLTQAIELTGLFIDQGPVVQVMMSNRKRQVYKDRERGIAYDGPLLVLIDRYSASASEIFAAAMQDYGRALVVGERSFGKGTVQRVAPLRYSPQALHKSTVKFTTAQFFRVSGDSTQHRGVDPDIALNSGVQDEEFGERAFDNALPWSQITPANFIARPKPAAMLKDLNSYHIQRSANSPSFNLLRNMSKRIDENRNLKEISLLLAERQEMRNEKEQQAIEALNIYRASLGLEPITAETREDNPLPDGDEHWNLVFYKEAAKILRDQSRWVESMIAKRPVGQEQSDAPANEHFIGRNSQDESDAQSVQ